MKLQMFTPTSKASLEMKQATKAPESFDASAHSFPLITKTSCGIFLVSSSLFFLQEDRAMFPVFNSKLPARLLSSSLLAEALKHDHPEGIVSSKKL
jgi:hypothetical protein